MDSTQALQAARAYLRNWIDLKPCDSPRGNLYGFDPGKEHLFEIVFGPELHMIGNPGYLAVSKETGNVRHLRGIG